MRSTAAHFLRERRSPLYGNDRDATPYFEHLPYSRDELERAVMTRLYDLFLVQRPESWGPAWATWLTPLQVAITRIVVRARRPLCIAEIARRLGCSRQTISRSVANLELKCYVDRRPGRRDRRTVEVRPRLTAGVPASAAATWTNRLPAALERTPEANLRALIAALDCLLERIRFVDHHNIDSPGKYHRSSAEPY